MEVTRRMPQYRCHKEVSALKIAAIEILNTGAAKIAPVNDGFAAFITGTDYAKRFGGHEGDLGYFVVYKDGYQSWSPTAAFEEGYTAL